MAFRYAFSRLAAERHDVAPHLVKFWKKYYPVEGQITQHLSPFQQKIMSPFFKDAHLRAIKKLKKFAVQAGPGLGFSYAVYSYAEWKHHDLALHHRS